MVSVALCTYNGEKYLQQQLESLLIQTRLPSEIVICDDQSTDNTAAIIEKFRQASKIPVHIHYNSERLGFTANSRKAIFLCKGEYIALCDQDDEWMKDKIEREVSFLGQHADKEVVFSDVLLADKDLKSLGRTMWEKLGFTRQYQRKWNSGKALDVLLTKGNVVTTPSIVMRSRFREKIDRVLLHKSRFWVNDGLIALTAARNNSIGFVDAPTLSYRLHAGQEIGIGKNSGKSMASISEELKDAIESRNDLVAIGFTPTELVSVDEKIRHLTVRNNLSQKKIKRVAPIVKELFTSRYYKYSNSFLGTAFRDLFRHN